MGPAEIVSMAVVALATVGGVLAYFKYKPGQREQVDMTIAQATMNVAQGTFQLVTTELEDQFKRMSGENKALRDEFEQYRRDTDAEFTLLRTQLRAEKAEKIEVKRENEQLRAKVAGLETEVVGLRAEVESLRNGQS